MKKRILILSFSPIARDPRVMRQIMLLNEKYELHVAGYGPRPNIFKGTYYEIDAPVRYSFFKKIWIALQLMLGAFENYYWNEIYIKKALQLLGGKKFNLLIANDSHALPLIFKISNNAPVLYDAHEYSPREFEDQLKWRLTFGKFNKYICEKYLKLLSGMTTVCDGIAREYLRNYGIRSKVVYNSPHFKDFYPGVIDNKRIKIIHHGVALKSRHIECMIKMMDFLDERFELNFYLVKENENYFNQLLEISKSNKNIKFHEPVSMNLLPEIINGYDIGLFLLPPVNFNYQHALPNKFFEFVQGRVAVAIGPSPEMAAIVQKYQIGIVAKSFDPQDLAGELSKLDVNELSRFKKESHKAARELNYEHAGSVMLSEIEHCLASSSRN